MATTDSLLKYVRHRLRDYPKFFEMVFDNTASRTKKLGHPLVSSIEVVVETTPTPTVLVENTDYTVEERGGFLRLAAVPVAPFVVTGYHFSWWLDEELLFFINHVIGEHTINRPYFNLANIELVEEQVIGLGAALAALWSLLAELAADIDVTQPEGVYIPARQRFEQFMRLADDVEKEYKKKAAMLNVGIESIEVFNVRRVSRTTGRLVPVYLPKEIDDTTDIVRVFPSWPNDYELVTP